MSYKEVMPTVDQFEEALATANNEYGTEFVAKACGVSVDTVLGWFDDPPVRPHPLVMCYVTELIESGFKKLEKGKKIGLAEDGFYDKLLR
jgi:hypothetical protein